MTHPPNAETAAPDPAGQQVRDVIQEWLAARKRGDLDRVLELTAPDVLFHVPGHEPFGRDFFAEISRSQGDLRVEGTCDTREVVVSGDLAFARNHLNLSFITPDGSSSERVGYSLSLYRRSPSGQWQLWRDANLVAPPKAPIP